MLADNKISENKDQKISGLSKINLRSYTMIFALIVIAIVFQVITEGIFLSPRNFSMLIRQMSIVAVITTGMVLLIISGNFDLSVGSMVALSGGVAAALHVWFGWDTTFSIIAAVIVGILLGAWQGYWVAYKKVPSFIVTLAGMMIFRGVYLVLSSGITITPLSPTFKIISQGFIPKTLGMILAFVACIVFIIVTVQGRISKNKYGFGLSKIYVFILKIICGCILILAFVWRMNDFLGVPIPVIVLICLVLIFMFVSRKTIFGRNIYAIGGNVEAARFSGINVEFFTFIMFIIMGVLSAISGILLTARLDGAVSAAGQMFEMDAIAACVIGGTSLSGGVGSIFGAMIGALIMSSLDNGMSLMNVSSYYQYIAKGLVLLLAVWFDISTKKK